MVILPPCLTSSEGRRPLWEPGRGWLAFSSLKTGSSSQNVEGLLYTGNGFLLLPTASNQGGKNYCFNYSRESCQGNILVACHFFFGGGGGERAGNVVVCFGDPLTQTPYSGTINHCIHCPITMFKN